MRKQRHMFQAAAAATGLALVLAGCSAPAAEPAVAESTGPVEVVPLTVAVPPSTFATALNVGINEGIFEEAGFELTLVTVTSMAEALPQLISGELQYAFSDLHNVLLAASEGAPLVAGAPIAVNATEPPANNRGFGNTMVLEGSGITNVKDLEGKTIGTNSIDGQAMLDSNTAMEKAGVDISTINWVAIPTQQAVAALRQGQVDALTIADPGASVAMAEGGVEIIASADNAIPGAPMFVLGALTDFITGNLEQAERFQAAVIAANALTNSDRELADTTLASFMPIPPEIIAQTTYPYFAEAPFTAAQTQPVIDRLVKLGLMTEAQVPDLNALFVVK